MSHHVPSTLLSVAAILVAFSLAADARAADDVCTASTATAESPLGKACTTAGPSQNQPGICESSPCDGGATHAGACYACLVDGTAGGCGGGRATDSRASFTPTVGGCCSVAGARSWETGAGVLLGTFLLGLVFAQRRRNVRR